MPLTLLLPAGLLGCLTMSAALVVGHAEISQLRPHERRQTQVFETAESPFRVMAGLIVPDPAPPHPSTPAPSAAAAPVRPIHAPVSAPADDGALVPAELPSEVPEPSWVRRRVDRLVAAAPEPARHTLADLVDTAFTTVRHGVGGIGLDYVLRKERQLVHPVVVQAIATERALLRPHMAVVNERVAPVREPANAAADHALDTARAQRR